MREGCISKTVAVEHLHQEGCFWSEKPISGDEFAIFLPACGGQTVKRVRYP